jgi:hypothetical protein
MEWKSTKYIEMSSPPATQLTFMSLDRFLEARFLCIAASSSSNLQRITGPGTRKIVKTGLIKTSTYNAITPSSSPLCPSPSDAPKLLWLSLGLSDLRLFCRPSAGSESLSDSVRWLLEDSDKDNRGCGCRWLLILPPNRVAVEGKDELELLPLLWLPQSPTAAVVAVIVPVARVSAYILSWGSSPSSAPVKAAGISFPATSHAPAGSRERLHPRLSVGAAGSILSV